MRTLITNQVSTYEAVADWCNSKIPSQTAEPQTEESAVQEVPPQLVKRLTKHNTAHLLGCVLSLLRLLVLRTMVVWKITSRTGVAVICDAEDLLLGDYSV